MFMTDMSGNAVVPVTSPDFSTTEIPSSPIQLDITRPLFTAASLDLNAGTLSLTFNEPVSYVAFRPSGNIAIQNSQTGATDSYTLLTPTPSDSQPNGLSLTLTLSAADILALEAAPFAAKSLASTWITMTSSCIKDVAGNQVQAVPNGNPVLLAIQVSAFQPNTAVPVLTSFSSYDQTNGYVNLVFSLPVDISTFDPTKLTVQSTAAGGTTFHLTGGVIAYIDSSTKLGVQVTITLADLLPIKTTAGLLRAKANSYISAASGLVKSQYGVAVGTTAALQVVTYVADLTSPYVTSFGLDLTAGTISLTFSDVMNTNINPLRITLQSDAVASGSTSTFTLTGGTCTSSVGYVFVVQLSALNANQLRLSTAVGRTTANTYLVVTADLISSIFGLPVLSILTSNALQATTVSANVHHPVVTSFTLNFFTQQIALTFDIAIDITTFSVTSLTLQNTISNPTSSYALTAVSSPASFSVSTLVLIVPLTLSDINNIRLTSGLATAGTTSYISFPSSLVSDSFGVTVQPILTSNALLASSYVNDGSSPVLLGFSLNMNSGVISLTFNKVIDPATIRPSYFTLQDARPAVGPTYTLTGGTASMTLSTTISITFSSTDLNAIKALTNLATSSANIYISALANYIQDVSANMAVAIVNNQAVGPAIAFTADTTAPTLVSYNLDMQLNQLTLSFSETIKTTSIKAQFIQLSSASSMGASVTLSSQTIPTSNAFSPVVVLQLAASDVINIKLTGAVALAKASTYMTYTSSFATDMASNAIVPGSVVQVTNFIADSTPPNLVSFAVDLSTGTLTFNFDEPVKGSTFSTSVLLLQANHALPALTYSLSVPATSITSSISLQIVVVIAAADVVGIELMAGLYTQLSNTYISTTGTLVKDVFNLNCNGILASNALHAASFNSDTNRPQVTYFSLDVSAGRIVLSFAEPIDTTAVVLTQITMQRYSTSSIAQVYTLTGGSLSAAATLWTGISITLTANDLNKVKLFGIGQSTSTAWLALASGTVRSAAGVLNLALVNGVNVKQADSVTVNTVKPLLNSFDFNQNTNLLTLHFSEEVSAGSIVPSHFAFYASNNALATSYTLTSSIVCTQCASNQFLVSSCTGNADTVCQTCSLCGANQILMTACTATMDTQCKTCATCSAGQYVIRACNGVHDTICGTCSTASSCPANQYQSAVCAANTDRACSPCSSCAVNQFVSAACTSSTNTQCTSCSSCPAGKFVSAACSTSADTQCSTCSTCTAGSTYLIRSCSGNQDTVCKNCKTCVAGEYVSSACTALTNTVCTQCSTCASNQFLQTPCGPSADSVCQTCTVCGTGMYTQSYCYGSNDAVCQPCSANCNTCTGPGASCAVCGNSMYLYQGACVATCPDGTYSVGAGATGRVCAPCHPVCKHCTGPASNQCDNSLGLGCYFGYTYLGGAFHTCNPACPAGFYDDPVMGCITSCDATCATCTGPASNQCVTCQAATPFFTSGTCSAGCSAGYYSDSSYSSPSLCRACEFNCNACTGAGNTCTQCASGFYLNNGRCFSSCPMGDAGAGL